MDNEKQDHKSVKIRMQTNQNTGEVLSRSMLYSGINIFGQLSQIYLQTKESGGSYEAFSAAVGKSGAGAAAGGDSGSVMNLSQDILSVFKRMQKKDPHTKVKALQELERYVDSLDSQKQLLDQSMQSEDISSSSTQSDEMQSLLTFFLYHFCRIIVNEHDKKVREHAHHTLAAFIRKAKRRLGPHLKRIFSLWYCSFFDPMPEVAALSRRNFEAAFPENKREHVFKIAYKNFLHFANEQLKQSEDAVSEQVAELTKAQKEDVFDRITSSVLQALAKSFDFTQNWNEEEKTHFQKKLIDILDLSAPIPTADGDKGAKKSLPNSYLWGFLQPKFRGRVRASCLIFISNLLLNLPQDVVATHISQLAPLVHNLVGEDNYQLQTSLWRDAFFTLGKNFPQSWEATNIKKNFLPKFNTCLKASAFGAPTALYENFVKFVSVFPLYHLIDYTEDKTNKASFKERANLLRETLTTLYQGLKNDESVAYHQDLMKCYSETFSFILLKRVQPLVVSEKASKEDKDFAVQQMKKCIQLPLEDYINNFQRFNSKVQNERNIRYTIANQLTKLLKDLADRNLDQTLYHTLIVFMNESINLEIDKPNIIRVIHALLKGFTNKESPYFTQNVLKGLVLNYITTLLTKVSEDVENLSKENIDGLSSKVLCLWRTYYKLNKFAVKVGEEQIMNYGKQLQTLFNKISMKEEMAKKVLSADVLAKFKTIKDNILKAVILNQNLSSARDQPDFKAFLSQSLQSATLDMTLKAKLLLPESGMPKIKFTQYFECLNQREAHDVIIEFVIKHIISDQQSIAHHYSIVDSGISKKPSFLLAEDDQVIAETALTNILSLKSNDYQGYQSYFSAVKSLLVKKDASGKIIEQLRESLFAALLRINSTHSAFQTLWSIYCSIVKAILGKERHPFFEYCIAKLKEQLTLIISDKRTQQFDAINRFTLIVKQFVQLIPSDRQVVIEEILLQESTFTSNLESNCLPLKMFRDLFLSGGLGGFDVTKLFTDSRYLWLASVLLNVRHLPSLTSFIEMKKQLIIFVDTELIPVLINQVQEGNSKLVLDIVQYMSNQAQTKADYIYSLEQFIKKMIDPGEDFPVEEKPVLKIDDFKTIYRTVSTQSDMKEYSNKVLLQMRILRQVAYFIIDEPLVVQTYKSASATLQSFVSGGKRALDGPTSIALEIFQALNKYLGAQGEDLTSKLLINLFQSQLGQSVDSNILNSLLTFTSSSLESLGVTTFTSTLSAAHIPFQSFLTWLFSVSSQLSPLTTMHLLSIVRKTLNAVDLIPDSQLIVQQVLDVAKHHATTFSTKADRVAKLMAQQTLNQEDLEKKKAKGVHFAATSEEVEEDSQIEEVEDFEQEMLQEAAETLVALSNHISPNLNENDLFALIVSGVEPLQKAAYVLLKQLYENFIPTLKFKIDEGDLMKQIKQEADEAEEHPEDKEEKKGGDHYHHHDHAKYKNKLAFKNISEILVDIMENPPAIEFDGSIHSQPVISGSTQVESLIFQETHAHADLINSKIFGYFLAWNALLIKIENGRIKSQLQGQAEYGQVLGALNEYLEENDGIYRMLLAQLLAYLPEEKRGLQEAYNVSSFEPEYMDLTQKHQVSLLTVFTLLNFMKSFPSLARKYCQECDKQMLDLVMPYIKQLVSPAILDNEIKKIEIAQLQLGASELSFALFKSTKEILANFKKGEIEMTLKIKIPTDYPLKLVEVDVSKQLKISEKQLRKWILAIRKIIQFQNGDIISAVLAWKANIEREIDGVEDCYICYAVVHETDQSLPKMPCKTCKNKFHVACIRKWFRQSHKSNCPICQNYFF